MSHGPRDRERGSATVWVLALAAVLVAIGAAAVLVAAAGTARHRAGSAADLAALAAAGRAVTGDPEACFTAALVAERNGARLTMCALEEGGEVRVAVSVPVRLGPLGVFDATGRARAGPAHSSG